MRTEPYCVYEDFISIYLGAKHVKRPTYLVMPTVNVLVAEIWGSITVSLISIKFNVQKVEICQYMFFVLVINVIASCFILFLD
jgi:hypothetical protein